MESLPPLPMLYKEPLPHHSSIKVDVKIRVYEENVFGFEVCVREPSAMEVCRARKEAAMIDQQ